MKSPSPQFWNKRRVFLTGHTGFKGSWLSIWLQKMGAEVCGFSLSPSTIPSLFDDCQVEKGMESLIGDIRDMSALSAAMQSFKPDVVLHLAAQPLVRESYSDPVGTFSTNIIGTANILEAARHVGCVRAVVNVTTDKCYENREWEWAYRENERLGGHDPYSSSKACSELITSSFRSSFFNDLGIGLATARAGNVIGGGDWSVDRLIPDVVRSIVNRKPLTIRNPSATRPWQHVLEPLSGYLILAENLFKEGLPYSEAWNFGPLEQDVKPVSWIADHIITLWGHDQKIIIDRSSHVHEANLLKLDISKAKTRLNWEPRWDLVTALDKIVGWNKVILKGGNSRDMCEQQISEFIESSKG